MNGAWQEKNTDSNQLQVNIFGFKVQLKFREFQIKHSVSVNYIPEGIEAL